MSLWDKLLNKTVKPAPLAITAGQGRGSSIVGSAYQDPRKINESLWMLYRSNPWVARCVDIIADSMSKGYELISEADETSVPCEQLEGFLNRPNDVDSFETFVGKIARSVLIHGIAFVEVQRVGLTANQVQKAVSRALSAYGNVVPTADLDTEDLVDMAIVNGIPKLMKLRPAWQMEVLTDKLGTVTGYKQYTAEGGVVDFAPHEIITILHPSSLDQKYGNSPLEAISTTALVDNQIRQRQKAVFKNATAIEHIFHLPATASKEDVERFNEQLTQRYRGVDAAGAFVVLNNPVTVEDLDKTDEGDYLKLKDVNKQEICQKLGVPLSVIGENEGGGLNGAGASTHYQTFIESTVRPLAAHIQRILNEQIVSSFESVGVSDILLKLVLESTEDTQALETMFDMMIKNGTMTPNEVRIRRGMDAYKGYGDEPYIDAKDVFAVKDVGVAPVAAPAPNPLDDVQKALTQTRNVLRELRKHRDG